jgi:TolB-like protein/Tfp pilus assembly protein PilF
VFGRKLDGRSDLFSLGAVLYFMATGRRPFEAESLPAILDAVLHRDPTPVTTINPAVPAGLDRVIRRCLAKSPAARYADARELRLDLERVAASAAPVWPRWLRSPRWPRRRTAVAAAVAGVLAAAAIAAAAVIALRQREADPKIGGSIPLLAVLPFSNQTGDPNRDHVGEALSAGLLADLGQITGLRLVAPASTRGAGADDAGVAARRLGAQVLLAGEVQDELGRLRVNARLVEASSGVVMWSRVSRAESTDLFHPQREIARGVTDFFSIPMSLQERRRLTQDSPSSLEAFAHYVEGRRQLGMADGAAVAVDLFAQAVAADPDFALAHVGLGEAQWTVYERTRQPERLRAAQEAVARARALDRDLPQTILVGMLVDASSGRLQTGEQLQQALSRHPRPAEASRLLAASYELAGNLDEAERLLLSATTLDPQDWFNWSWLGAFLLQHRGPDRALEALERADRLAPSEVWQPRAYLGAAALQQGRFDDAIALLEGLPAPITDAAAASNLAMAYYYSQRSDKWERAEERFRAAIELSPERAEYHGNLADLQAERGRAEEAVVGYRRAMELSRAETEANPGDHEARLRVAL